LRIQHALPAIHPSDDKFLSQSLGIHAAFPYENLCVAKDAIPDSEKPRDIE
jgi:hypothetical protein